MSDLGKIRKRARTYLLPFITLLLVSWVVIFFGSCRYYKLEQKLDPVNKDWYNRVRYIITKEESHIFLDLPDEEKEQFKEEFWERRDPDPNTEENEFKLEYYKRMDDADELFISEGKPGWMTDRGRIYVIYGPPDEVERHPYELDSVPYEIWYYYRTAMKFIFVDEHGIGDYRLFSPRGERW